MAHLVADDQRLALGVPGQGKGIAQALDLVHAVLGADIPELYDAVVAHAAQLGLLDGVEGDLLNGGIMTLELGREADVGALGVPLE